MIFSMVLGTAASIAIAQSSCVGEACDFLVMSPPPLPALLFGFAAVVYINQLGKVGKQRALRAAPTQISAAMACFPLPTARR